MRKALVALALLYLIAHLAWLPSTFADLDSINFALGVRDFDVSKHQPHPPGYPVFIGLAKLSTGAFEAASVAGAEARGLAVWSAVFGSLLVPALFALFQALDGSSRRAWWATVLSVTCPVMWFTALRPMSDIPGLTAAVVSQALLVRAINGAPAPRYFVSGALAAGIAIGIRSQTFLLTLPLLVLALTMSDAAGRRRLRLATCAAFLAGVLLWAVPLVIASGGLSAYLTALTRQGDEDFSGVVMFWNFPTIRVGLSALRHTFLSPWASVVLAAAVLLPAIGGMVAIAGRMRTVAILAAISLPYAIFHLLFHETITVRYALPLVPVIAWLAVRGVDHFATRALPVTIGLVAAGGLWLAVPSAVQAGISPPPAFRAIADLSAARRAQPVTVGSHRRVFTESRRVRMWLGEAAGAWLDAPRDFEWLELTRAWRSGSASHAWFFADPQRTDLALIDAEGSRVVRYQWPFDGRVYVGGARPDEFNVHTYTAPGWFLEQGWALTPEVAGVTEREGWGPHLRPAVGWIRRRAGESEMLLGGRHLGSPGEPLVRIVATVDGRTVFDREAGPGFFDGHVTLPPGSLAGGATYAPLLVRALAPSGGAVPVSLEQFDLQSAGVPMFAYGEGWHEPEYKPETGRRWRWMSERAALWIRPVGRDLTLRLMAESPGRYFDRIPTLRLSLGGQPVAQLAPSDDFTWTVTLAAAALALHNGQVLIETDQWFAPGGAGGGGDQRHLAVRVYSVSVE